jgi:hypothetical protein
MKRLPERLDMTKKNLIAALPLAALCAVAAQPLLPAAAAGQEGMVVARDPQTGQLRAPSAAEMKALAAQRPTAAAAVQPVVPAQPTLVARPDNTRQVRMGQKGLVFEVVTRDADGKLVERCVQGEGAALDAVEHPAATAKDNQEHRHDDR